MLSSELHKQLESIQALQKVLKAETACLKEKDFSNLSSILSSKQNLLETILNLDKILSIEQSQTEINNNDDLLALKEEIEKQLQASHKINLINGKLVELSMKSNKHLMQLIRQAAGTNTVTYNQKGGLSSGSLLGKNIKA